MGAYGSTLFHLILEIAVAPWFSIGSVLQLAVAYVLQHKISCDPTEDFGLLNFYIHPPYAIHYRINHHTSSSSPKWILIINLLPS
jgi:hypothetical protein